MIQNEKLLPESRLITAPKVHVVAMTAMNVQGIEEWAEDHNILNILNNNSSALGKLYDSMTNSDGDPDLDGIMGLDTLPEFAGRFCYRAFETGRNSSDYISNVLEMAHGSIFEHATISFAISGVSRSLTHELARHRAGVAISQESQRYVDASDINFVVPPLLRHIADKSASNIMLTEFRRDCQTALDQYICWQNVHMEELEADAKNSGETKYQTRIKKRANEAARAHLPNASETRLVWTLNLRALRHVMELRGGEGADLEFRDLINAMSNKASQHIMHALDDVTQTPPGQTDYGIPQTEVLFKKV